MASPLALIIEDHIDAATIFSEAMKAAQFETEIIQSGDVAMTRLAATTPDVIVLDLNLPQVPGVEILRHIRADARLADTCVIVATAHPRMADDLHQKADLVLIKPVSFTQLRNLATRLGIATTPGE